MRAASRAAGVSINTVTKLLVDAGEACAEYHDETVRGVKARRVQCDEIWSFCYAKAKNVPAAKAAPHGAGDVWTWTAIDSDSKMILAYEVGDRSGATAFEFMNDLRLEPHATHHGRQQCVSRGGRGCFRGRHGPRHARQVVRTACGPGARAPLQPARMHRDRRAAGVRLPRSRPHQHELCGAPQPHDADGDAAVHPAHQRLLEEDREPPAHAEPLLRPLQLLPHPQVAPHDPGDGCEGDGHAARHGVDREGGS